MNNAVHKLIIGKHHSLLVTQRGKIAGVLRLSDVFDKIIDLSIQNGIYISSFFLSSNIFD